MGCPSAIAPPLTFTRRSSHSSIFPTDNAWAANASLASIRSTSVSCQPARSRQRRVAYTGAIPISAGSTPTLANARMRASTGSPSAWAFASLIIITAAAPSLIEEALPAVTEPKLSNAGCSRANPSALASARGCSSVSTIAVCPLRCVTMGTISSLKRPVSIAALAFCCELSA